MMTAILIVAGLFMAFVAGAAFLAWVFDAELSRADEWEDR